MRVAFFLESLSATAPAHPLTRVFPYLQHAGISFRCFTGSPLDEPAAREEVIGLQPFSAALFPDQQEAQALSDRVSWQLKAFQPDVIHLADTSLLGLLGLSYARSHQLPLVATYSPQEADQAGASYLRWFYGACQLVLVENDKDGLALIRLGLTHTRIERLATSNSLVRSRQLRGCYQQLQRECAAAPGRPHRQLRRRNAEQAVAVPQLAVI